MTDRRRRTFFRRAMRREWLVGAALFLLALLPRLYQIEAAPPGLNGDEVYNLIDARRIGLDHLPLFFPGNNGREALYFYLLALSVRLFGDSVWALRLPSALLGSGVVTLAYVLGRYLFNRRVGAAAAALIMVSFWPIMLSRMGLRAISLPFFTALAILLLFRALQSGRLSRWLLGGAALGLTLYTYIPARVFPLVIAGWLLWVGWRRRAQLAANGRALLLSLLLAAAVFAPFGVYMARYPELVNQRIASMSNALDRARAGEPEALLASIGGVVKMFSIQGDVEWRYHLAGQPVFDPLMSVFFYLGLALCVVRALRAADDEKQQPEYALLLLWLGAMLAPIAVLNENPSFIRAAGAIVPVYLITGVGLEAGWAWLRRRWRAPAWAGPLLLSVAASLILLRTARDYLVVWVNHPQVRTVYHAEQALMGRYLEENEEPDDARVFIAYDYVYDSPTALSFSLFSDRAVSWFDRSHTFPWADDEATDSVYLIPSAAQLPADALRQLQQKGREEVVYFENGDPAFTVYRLPQAVLTLSPQHETDLSFDNGLRLRGYDVVDTAFSGDLLNVRLYWQIAAGHERGVNRLNYVQVHLADVAGIVRGRGEALLGFPQAGWLAGDRYIQEVEVATPQGMLPGPATLAFGLRDDRGQPLGPMQADTGEPPLVVRSRPVVDFTLTPQMPLFDDTLALVDAVFRPLATPGAALNVELHWMPLRQPQQDYRVQLALVREGGEEVVLAQTFALWPALYPPTAWRPLEAVTTLHSLRIPVDFDTEGPLALQVRALPQAGPGEQPTPATGGSTVLGEVALDMRPRTYTAPELEQSVEVQFGDAFRLIGYSLDSSQAQPGGTVGLTLAWQAIETPDDNYTVFNHLVGGDGQTVGQFDAPPVGDAWLTETWLPGEIVVEERQIAVGEDAPAGEVTLVVGLYNADNLERLPAYVAGERQAGDQYVLQSFQLKGAE